MTVPFDSTPDDDDRTLLARLRDDDTRALEALIDRYALKLRGVAMLVVRRTDLAEDVVQSTFVSVWERRQTMVVQGSVAGYLYRMARNLALKSVRHENAESRAYAVVLQSLTSSGSMVQNDGAARIGERELMTVVQRVLDGLQPQVREVFLLRRLRALSYEEIAETLGVSVVSVRSQMSRAIRKLGEALRDWP